MIDRSYFLVDMHYNEEKSKMKLSERIRYEDYQSRYDNRENVVMKRLIDDGTLLMLNSRHLF